MQTDLDEIKSEFNDAQKQLDNLKIKINDIQKQLDHSTVEKNIVELESKIKEEKSKHKELFKDWVKYANETSYRLLEKRYLREKELAHLTEENNLLKKLLDEEIVDVKFEYSREYLTFFKKNKYRETFFQLSLISDSFLGFFRNTTPIIFLTVATRYFYQSLSWDLNLILIGFIASVICLIASFLLNCLFLLNALTEKLTEESVRLEKLKLFILIPAYFSYLCSVVVIWEMAGKYF